MGMTDVVGAVVVGMVVVGGTVVVVTDVVVVVTGVSTVTVLGPVGELLLHAATITATDMANRSGFRIRACILKPD
jgi:hypothetical protein